MEILALFDYRCVKHLTVFVIVVLASADSTAWSVVLALFVWDGNWAKRQQRQALFQVLRKLDFYYNVLKLVA